MIGDVAITEQPPVAIVVGPLDDPVTGADGEEVDRVCMPVTRVVDTPAEVRAVGPNLPCSDPSRGDDVSEVLGVAAMPRGTLDARPTVMA